MYRLHRYDEVEAEYLDGGPGNIPTWSKYYKPKKADKK